MNNGLNFYQRCEIMKKENQKHNLYTMNQEYVRTNFFKLFETYKKLNSTESADKT